MKVYVDELPKRCIDCPCYYIDEMCSYCTLYAFDSNEIFEQKADKQKHQNCPLQTITDHDKQVRKQVCSEIGSEIYAQMIVYGKELRYSDLNLILDQIEKGE